MAVEKKIRAGIAGAAGYTGGELIRLLLNHPNVEIVFLQSNSNAGESVSKIHDDLAGETDLKFSDRYSDDVDVMFLCSGHGKAKIFLTENKMPDNVHIIDIGNDFRLQNDSLIGSRQFVYGLPEMNRDKIITAKNIANPGCFATAIQLGLLPLAANGLLSHVYTTGITGSTGAGQGLSATSHFSWRANNIQPYKTLTHQHLGEIAESLQKFQPAFAADSLSFVPWRGDFTRGIFVSSQLTCDKPLNELYALYNKFYANGAFVHVSEADIHLKQVVNTNKAIIKLEKTGNTLVVHSAIDNLLKGASGQAVQNMNLMFGLAETTGLKLKAASF